MTSTTAATDLYWDKLDEYLRHACSLFGLPEKLAQRLWLSRREHKLISAFLRPLEELVRRLIFIAALELAPMTLPPTPERKYRARLAMPANAGAAFDPNKPDSWRVSFKLSLERRRPAGICASAAFDGLRQAPSISSAGLSRAERVSKAARAKFASAPSAERLQAVINAFNNRDKLAAALARKIARNARAAHAYVARPSTKLAHKPVWITLFALIPLASEAHQRFIHSKLDALRTDSS